MGTGDPATQCLHATTNPFLVVTNLLPVRVEKKIDGM